MDASTLAEHMKHLAAAGSATLNIDERLRLELALDLLSDQIKFEFVQLWGKINGRSSIYIDNFGYRSRPRLLHCGWH